jgi:CHAT domain-containing protein
MRDDGRFTLDDEDILIGSNACRLLRLLRQLRSGQYGLIHYSGHSVFEGDQSAWVLKDGRINTFDLTSSLRDAPPAMVFSSSCESAEAGEPRAIKYEDQTFDLPSAFLNAGVEAYVGTLWEVESTAARQFAEAFYRALLTEGHCLGEALRLAKMASKAVRDRINWLAFILYGDPHAEPGHLFPALLKQ